MNSRGGVYTVGIAIIAVVVLSLTIFSTQAIMFEEESEDYVAVMSDARMAWQNTALLFGGAVKDGVQGACPAGPANSAVIDGYFASILTTVNDSIDPGVDCQFAAVNFAGGDPTQYTVRITCLRNIDIGGKTKFMAEYAKEVTYNEGCP